MDIITINIRIGRGDGYWSSYPIERTLEIHLPYGQKELLEKELKEIEQYSTLLANREQAIIRCECDNGDTFIYSPTKWKKRR